MLANVSLWRYHNGPLAGTLTILEHMIIEVQRYLGEESEQADKESVRPILFELALRCKFTVSQGGARSAGKAISGRPPITRHGGKTIGLWMFRVCCSVEGLRSRLGDDVYACLAVPRLIMDG